jgi:antitoxin YefM
LVWAPVFRVKPFRFSHLRILETGVIDNFYGHCEARLDEARRSLLGLCKRTKKRTLMSMNASEARKKLYRLIDDTAAAHEPLLITGPRSNAVLVGEEDWNSIQETLYLLSVPGMRESIREGLETPIEKCAKEPGW